MEMVQVEYQKFNEIEAAVLVSAPVREVLKWDSEIEIIQAALRREPGNRFLRDALEGFEARRAELIKQCGA